MNGPETHSTRIGALSIIIDLKKATVAKLEAEALRLGALLDAGDDSIASQGVNAALANGTVQARNTDLIAVLACDKSLREARRQHQSAVAEKATLEVSA